VKAAIHQDTNYSYMDHERERWVMHSSTILQETGRR
jgi:hypothetical protein